MSSVPDAALCADALQSPVPAYNPYAPGILPPDLDSEIARVQHEVRFIFNEALVSPLAAVQTSKPYPPGCLRTGQITISMSCLSNGRCAEIIPIAIDKAATSIPSPPIGSQVSHDIPATALWHHES
jgi:hypothetical protein